MPKVAINSQDGPANVPYTISTPTYTSAEKIDPTVIFLHAVYNWAVCFPAFDEFHSATVGFFVEDVIDSQEKFRKISCPVKLIQRGADIAYPLHHAEELLQRLVDVGVSAELDVLEEAPHFGTATQSDA
ncbi:hypothetical protein H0H87_002793 [Tephrocybe sp. NHM501043]|nr:hypothetical protein H0H87_002793 [Tephrocybe sp. NHM501043]